MLDAIPERVIRFRVTDHTISYCNTAWAAGHDAEPADVIGHKIHEFLSPTEMDGLEFRLARLRSDDVDLADDVARTAPNTRARWVERVDRCLPDAGGAEVLVVGRDVRAHNIADLNAADGESRFRHLADKSADVVWRFVLKPFPHFDYMSPSIQNLLGYPPSFFLDDFTRFLDILDDEGRALVDRALHGELMPERFDLHYRRADGSTAIGETQTTLIRGGLQGVGRDVTDLRHLQEDLAALALHDPLTGLANRRLFQELLKADLARTQRSGQPLAVAYLDIDGFKNVNDTHGHDAGDAVLCETARRLLSIVRGADVVARLGGDEFVIVYEPNDPSSDNLIARIDRALSAPIHITPTTAVSCPASIGIADTRKVGSDATALLAAADDAMYESKRARHSVRDV